MRYAIVSDIHSNLQAWNAVLLDIRSMKADRIICLGDLVGYGPNPRQVMESVHASVHFLVLGNHDAVLCGKLDATLFNENARRILKWTRDQLGPAAVKFLSGLPLSLRGSGFRCAHGDFSEPGQYNYVIDPPDALPSWRAVDDPLLFVGHSHQPALYLLGRSGTPHRLEPQDFVIEPEKRFLVNVGSVGQPRDGDVRASYCLYDTEGGAVYWRRIPFDLDAYRTALADAALPEAGSWFLSKDPHLRAQPLRKVLSFSPPDSPDKGVKDAVAVQDLEVLQGRVKRWKAAAAILLAAFLALAGGGAWAWQRHAHRVVEIGHPQTPRLAEESPPDTNLLPLPSRLVPAGSPIEGWTVRLGNRYRQAASVAPIEPLEFAFVLRSDAPADEIRLIAQTVRLSGRTKLRTSALFKKSNDFEGTVAIVISLDKKTAGGEDHIDQFITKEPLQARRGGWLMASKTVQKDDLPAGAQSIRFEIRGRFRGTVEVKAPLLACVPD